jgi:mono/diheme cytochrome c family protein
MARCTRLLTTVGIASVFVALSLGASAQTIKRETARPISSIAGADTFKAYCASCHGTDAKGTGPAAKALKTPPADLTTYAKRHGGKFSAADVEATIVGKAVSEAHGSREMPIWGPVLSTIATDDMQAKLRMANLVDYLRSIQVP